LKNDLNSKIEVKLYPKAIYKHFDSYKLPAEGNYKLNQFSLNSGEEYDIYSKSNLDIIPAVLFSEIFDSLEVKTDLYLIKFKPKKTLHYNSNLFDDNSNWILKKVELTAPTQFKRNPISSDNYYFIIKQENITK
jgi:hypothetical protein